MTSIFSKFLRAGCTCIGAFALIAGGCASTNKTSTQSSSSQPKLAGGPAQTFSQNELVQGISTHLGVTAEAAASAIQRTFKDRGQPVAYITGEEGGGAFGFGARYGKGKLWMKNGQSQKLYWQGPTVGFDVGVDASKVFVLVYDLQDPNDIYQNFPGVDGSAYLVAGLAVNYQRASGITLAPVRSGVGVRLGANVGYTSYTRKRSLIPL